MDKADTYHYEPQSVTELRQALDERGENKDEIDSEDIKDDEGMPENARADDFSQ